MTYENVPFLTYNRKIGVSLNSRFYGKLEIWVMKINFERHVGKIRSWVMKVTLVDCGTLRSWVMKVMLVRTFVRKRKRKRKRKKLMYFIFLNTHTNIYGKGINTPRVLHKRLHPPLKNKLYVTHIQDPNN